MGKIHLFACRAVKRERRKGSSRRQQTTYGAAIKEVARELLRSTRSLKREKWRPKVHQARRDDRFSSLFLSLLLTAATVPTRPTPLLLCSPLSLSPTRFDAFKDVIALMLPTDDLQLSGCTVSGGWSVAPRRKCAGLLRRAWSKKICTRRSPWYPRKNIMVICACKFF